MKLSIIIPVYNAELYLEECIMSIVKEIDNEMEIIIVDDGSKDNSKLIYSKYINKYNIKVYKNKNKGASYARNFGISKAVGKYIMFVDSDDNLKNGWSNIVNNILDKKEEVIYLANDLESINSDKNSIIDYILKSKHLFSVPWSKLYNRKFIIKNNIIFDENVIIGEDMLFNLLVLFKTNNYCFYSKEIYNYRQNENSISHAYNKKYYKSNIYFLNKLGNLFNEYKVNLEFKNKCINYIRVSNIFQIIFKIASLGMKDAISEFNFFLKDKNYKKMLNIKYNKKEFSKFQNLVLMLFKYKLYILDILLIKFVRFIIKFKGKV